MLPDGCMDLLWVDGRLLVAGPDTGPHPAGEVRAGAVAGIRLAPGTAPALLGVPAHALRDRRVGLADLWPPREVRRLTGLVAGHGDPRAGLEALARPAPRRPGRPIPSPPKSSPGSGPDGRWRRSRPRRLRSDFINGIKYLPVRFG